MEDANSGSGRGSMEDKAKKDRTRVRIGEFGGAVEALGEGEEVE